MSVWQFEHKFRKRLYPAHMKTLSSYFCCIYFKLLIESSGAASLDQVRMSSAKAPATEQDGVNPALPISPLPVAEAEPITAPPPVAAVVKKSHGELLTLQAIAGASAGAVAKTATAPLERIKIIFQVQVRRVYWFDATGFAVGGTQRPCTSDSAACFTRILAPASVRSALTFRGMQHRKFHR